MASKTLPKILRPILKIYADGKEHSAASIKDNIAKQIREGKITLDKALSPEELLGCICVANGYFAFFGLLKEPSKENSSGAGSKRGALRKRVITHKGLEIYKNGPKEITYKYLKEYSESEKKGSLKEPELNRKESAAKTLDLLNKEIAEQKKAVEQAQSANNFFEDPPVHHRVQNTSHTEPLPLNCEKEKTSLLKELEKLNQGGTEREMAATQRKKTVSLMEDAFENRSEDLSGVAKEENNRKMSNEELDKFFNDTFVFASKDDDDDEEYPKLQKDYDKLFEDAEKSLGDLLEEDNSWSESSLDYDGGRYVCATEAKDTKVPEKHFTPPLGRNGIKDEKETLEQLKEDIKNKIAQYDKRYQETLKNILGTLSEEKLEKLILAVFRESGYEDVTDKEGERFKYTNIKVLRDCGGMGRVFVNIGIDNSGILSEEISDSDLVFLVGKSAGLRGTLVCASAKKFSEKAREYAKEQDIILLDRDCLAEAIQNLEIGSNTPWDYLPEIDYDYFKNL